MLLCMSFICFSAGCSSDKEKIIGHWVCEADDEDLIFYKNGMGEIPDWSVAFDWTISDGKLKLDFDGIYGSHIFDYKLEKKTLILKYDGSHVDIYKKQD